MGVDKAGVVLDGHTLGARALATLRELDPSVVVLGHGRGLVLDARDVRLADVVTGPDARPAGPLAGIAALLASDLADAYVVLPVDMPRVTLAVLTPLLDALRAGAPVACFDVDGVLAPFPVALWAASHRLVLERLQNQQRGVGEAWRALGVQTIPLDNAGVLHNVNAPADLKPGLRLEGP
jgi:molybdopterin-guanine dinucleotide biosynthesis protein A